MSFVSKEGDLVALEQGGRLQVRPHHDPRFKTKVVSASRPAFTQEYKTAIGDPYRSHGGEYASQFDDLVNYYIRRGWSPVGGVTAMPPAPRSSYEGGSGYAAIGLVRNVAWDAPPLVSEHLGEAYAAKETPALTEESSINDLFRFLQSNRCVYTMTGKNKYVVGINRMKIAEASTSAIEAKTLEESTRAEVLERIRAFARMGKISYTDGPPGSICEFTELATGTKSPAATVPELGPGAAAGGAGGGAKAPRKRKSRRSNRKQGTRRRKN